MKLYVWKDVYDVSYGTACLYAVADSEDEARGLAKSARVSHYGMDPYEEHTPLSNDVLGPPTRVLDLPCAEIIHWEE